MEANETFRNMERYGYTIQKSNRNQLSRISKPALRYNTLEEAEEKFAQLYKDLVEMYTASMVEMIDESDYSGNDELVTYLKSIYIDFGIESVSYSLIKELII
jgi:hypothetical protein